MRLALIVLCLSGLIGCSGNNAANNGTNNSDSDVGVDASVEPPDVDNTGVEYADNYSTRLTKLQFAGAPAADLNGIIALNLDQSLDEPIILLVELQGLDADAGSVELKAGSGLKGTADTFVYDPDSEPSSVPATVDIASGAFEGTFELYRFVSTIEFSGDVQKVNIPIRDLTISGVLDLSADGATASIPQGKWDGHITKADGDVTMISLAAGQPERPLTELFREDSLNYDTASQTIVATGTGDAWKIDATFVAEAATVSGD